MLGSKKALITGASKGVGQTIAETFAKEGAFVALVARNEDALEDTAQRCKDAGAAGVSVHPTDLSSLDEVNKLAEELLGAHGHLDVLVNCAGYYPDVGKNVFLEGDPDSWFTALDLNVLTPMFLTRALAPAMEKAGGGYIINVGSVAGRKPVADEGAYSATKWAMHGWSNACYEVLRQHNIKVSLIEPAHIATDMALMQEGSRYEKMKPELMIQAEDVAEAALLPFRMSANADPAVIVLNRLQTPYDK